MFNVPFLQGRRSWLQPLCPFYSLSLLVCIFCCSLIFFFLPNLIYQALFLFSSANPILSAEFFHTCCLITLSPTQFHRISMIPDIQIKLDSEGCLPLFNLNLIRMTGSPLQIGITYVLVCLLGLTFSSGWSHAIQSFHMGWK